MLSRSGKGEDPGGRNRCRKKQVGKTVRPSPPRQASYQQFWVGKHTYECHVLEHSVQCRLVLVIPSLTTNCYILYASFKILVWFHVATNTEGLWFICDYISTWRKYMILPDRQILTPLSGMRETATLCYTAYFFMVSINTHQCGLSDKMSKFSCSNT